MNIAIGIPHWWNKENIHILTLKTILAKIFPIQKNLEKALTCDLTQSKKIYSKLLRGSIDKIHDLIDENQDDLHFTKDGQWICFGCDDPMIRDILMKYDFLKEWNELDKSKIKNWIKSIHAWDMHHIIAKNSLIKFNEPDKPYLDFDDTTGNIVVKKDVKLADWTYTPIPSGRRSFKN